MKVEVGDKLRRQIMDEIAENTEPPRLAKHEFTSSQYAEKAGINKRTARSHLHSLVDDGVLQRRKVLHGGRICWAFSKVEGDDEGSADTPE